MAFGRLLTGRKDTTNLASINSSFGSVEGDQPDISGTKPPADPNDYDEFPIFLRDSEGDVLSQSEISAKAERIIKRSIDHCYRIMPGWSKLIRNLYPKEALGFGTFGIDHRGFMVYDPRVVLQWQYHNGDYISGNDLIVGVIAHEICHRVFRHYEILQELCAEMKIPNDGVASYTLNISGDLVINTMLIKEGFYLDGGVVPSLDRSLFAKGKLDARIDFNAITKIFDVETNKYKDSPAFFVPKDRNKNVIEIPFEASTKQFFKKIYPFFKEMKPPDGNHGGNDPKPDKGDSQSGNAGDQPQNENQQGGEQQGGEQQGGEQEGGEQQGGEQGGDQEGQPGGQSKPGGKGKPGKSGKPGKPGKPGNQSGGQSGQPGSPSLPKPKGSGSGKPNGKPDGKPEGSKPGSSKPGGSKPEGSKPEGSKPGGAKFRDPNDKPYSGPPQSHDWHQAVDHFGDKNGEVKAADIKPGEGANPDEFEDAVKEALRNSKSGKGIGAGSAEVEMAIEKYEGKPRVVWVAQLVSLVNDTYRVKGDQVVNIMKPSRRSSGVIRPGQTRASLPSYEDVSPSIFVALDTSGSMTGTPLSLALKELESLLDSDEYENSEKTFVCSDDHVIGKVTKVNTIQDLRKIIKGQGGTSFGPVFDYIMTKMKDNQPDIIIYITDGDGDVFEHHKPRNPIKGSTVIWILTERNEAQAKEFNKRIPWGIKIALPEDKKARAVVVKGTI